MPCSSLKTKNLGQIEQHRGGEGKSNRVWEQETVFSRFVNWFPYMVVSQIIAVHLPVFNFSEWKGNWKKSYLTFFPLVYHIFPLVLKCYCKVKPNTSGGYCNHIANNMHYNRVRWGIDQVLIRRHHFCQVRISVDYKSYHADQKLLEKVSNLSKLSLINLTYKYELA